MQDERREGEVGKEEGGSEDRKKERKREERMRESSPRLQPWCTSCFFFAPCWSFLARSLELVQSDSLLPPSVTTTTAAAPRQEGTASPDC